MKKCMALAALVAAVAGGLRAEETLPSWTFYLAEEPGNPYPGTNCIVNDTWALAANIKAADVHTLIVTSKAKNENAFIKGLDLSDTLDMRGTILSSDGQTKYTITHIDQYALGADAVLTNPSTPKNFRSPSTITGGLWGWFNGFTVTPSGEVCGEQLACYTNIVIDVPGWFEEVNCNQVPRTEGDLHWRLMLPDLRKIGSWAFTGSASGGTIGNQYCEFGKDTSLGHLRYVSSNALSNRRFSGNLDLPMLENVDSWGLNGNNPGFTEIRLAVDNKCLVKLDEGCLGWNNSLTNVVLGLCATNKIYGQVLAGNKSMTRLEFTGEPPNFMKTNKTFLTGPAEKAVTIIVPNSVSWRRYLDPFEKSGDFVRWTAEEINAYRQENPDKPLVIGTVSPNVFQSDKTQYLAIPKLDGGDWLEYEKGFGDEVEISLWYQKDAPTVIGFMATLTAKPNAAKGGAFAGWYGDVPDGKCFDETVTVSLGIKPAGRTSWVFARFTHPWTLCEVDGSAAVITNGEFRVNVKVDAGNRTATIGSGAAGGLYTADNTGTGILDLGGEIRDDDGGVWKLVGLSGANRSLSAAKGGNGARVFVSPGTMTSWTLSQTFHATNDKATYESIIIDEPRAGTGDFFTGWMFSDQSLLKHIIVRSETLDGGSFDGAFYNGKTKDTDIGWWDMSGAKSFSKAICRDANTRAYGSIRLKSAQAIGDDTFKNGDFCEVMLGHGSKRTQVASIGANAFLNDAKITNIVINAAATLTVNATAFAGVSGLRTVTYLGPAVSEQAFAGLLAGVGATEGDKPVTVFVSPYQKGWTTANWLSAPTEEEKAIAPAKLLGVYRAGAAAPLGKAWVCMEMMPFDRPGLHVIVR